MSPPRQTSFFLVTKHKKRGDKEKQIFSVKAKFSLFGGQIYIKSISRETSLLLNLLCIVCAFSAL